MSKVKNWLKSKIPTKETLEENRLIKPFAPILKKSPNYWLFNRSSVTRGCAIAVFGSFMPMPFQMVIALILSLPARANLIISLGLLWINNPLTIVPIYWLCYKVGAWILRLPLEKVDMHLSWHWMTHELAHVWQPFLLGCLVCGLAFGAMTYFAIFFVWQSVEKHLEKHNT